MARILRSFSFCTSMEVMWNTDTRTQLQRFNNSTIYSSQWFSMESWSSIWTTPCSIPIPTSSLSESSELSSSHSKLSQSSAKAKLEIAGIREGHNENSHDNQDDESGIYDEKNNENCGHEIDLRSNHDNWLERTAVAEQSSERRGILAAGYLPEGHGFVFLLGCFT